MKKIILLITAVALVTGVATQSFAAKVRGGSVSKSSLSTNTLATAVCTNAPRGSFDATNRPACTNLPTLNTNAATDLAARTATFYAAVAPFDADLSGALDSTEQTALYTALTNGTVAFLGTNACVFKARDAANVTSWIAALYAQVVAFDADKNGILDDTEQAALAAAFEANTVSLPLFAPLAPHGHGGGPGRGHAMLTSDNPIMLAISNHGLPRFLSHQES